MGVLGLYGQTRSSVSVARGSAAKFGSFIWTAEVLLRKYCHIVNKTTTSANQNIARVTHFVLIYFLLLLHTFSSYCSDLGMNKWNF